MFVYWLSIMGRRGRKAFWDLGREWASQLARMARTAQRPVRDKLLARKHLEQAVKNVPFYTTHKDIISSEIYLSVT